MDYVGVVRSPANAIVIDYLKTYDPYFITPAVAMTCISSRVLLIWLLNVFGIIFCLSLSRVISSKKVGCAFIFLQTYNLRMQCEHFLESR